MSLQSSYLTDLQTKLTALVPANTSYTIRVIDEYSVREVSTDDADTILCIVRWGSATKPVTDQSATIQPMTFTVWSEGDGFDAAKSILSAFFTANARTTGTLDSKAVIYDYSSPTLMGAPQIIDGIQRWLLVMVGTLNYSDDLMIGTTVTLNGNTIHPLTETGSYNTQPITPQVYGAATGKALIQGANNTIVVSYYAGTTLLDIDLIAAAHGGPLSNTSITFGATFGGSSLTVGIACAVTGILSSYDQQTKRTTITVTLIPK